MMLRYVRRGFCGLRNKWVIEQTIQKDESLTRKNTSENAGERSLLCSRWGFQLALQGSLEQFLKN